MTSAEFHKLFLESSRRLREGSTSTVMLAAGGELRLACSVLTLTMLLTSSSLQRAKTLSVRDDPPEQLDEDVVVLAKNADGMYYWFMKPSRPEIGPIPDRYVRACVPDAEVASLPVNQELARLLGASLIRAGKVVPTISAAAFEIWLAEIDPTQRISQAMVTDWLLLRLLFQYADIATAAVILCRQNIGEGSRAHYTSLSKAEVRRRYVAVLAAIPCPDSELLAPQKVIAQGQKSKSMALGAKYLPCAISLRAVFRHLRAGVTRNPPGTERDLARRHNDLISNSYLGLALAVAARPDVKLLDVVRFDRTLAWACVDDKSAPDGASARYVALPADVTRQMRTILEHCRRLRYLLRSNEAAATDPIYLLDESLTPLPLAGSSVQAEIDRCFPFPLDSVRRFLRSTFVRRRVSPDQIDLLLGHSLFGQEPHRQTSTLDFLAVAHAARKTTGQLLHQLGYRPLESWLS